ncbi:uncharacterized protein A1O9_13085 [Exophiala aquamarina CBS 119918]|uniref:E3 ubiquitin ligase complex SCF subunit sconC n=1 Tax=Exophiala aquamarina CBS 119918 TaxID=1182545 RepID=A0A072NV05_9EURO|nr:uncharacterized protein A1O9_13085 [Exophiala aquamarina CBS 119918]KEF50863.1 hypothetical protein A1O9_13085 [Exophiala aquamarina CBS 119918]
MGPGLTNEAEPWRSHAGGNDVKLTGSDGEEIISKRDVACQSGLIKGLIDVVGEEEAILMPIPSSTLKLVFQWAAVKPDTLDRLGRYHDQWSQQDLPTKVELVWATNYLDIPDLWEKACTSLRLTLEDLALANWLSTSLNSIRLALDIPDDLTVAQRQRIRLERISLDDYFYEAEREKLTAGPRRDADPDLAAPRAVVDSPPRDGWMMETSLDIAMDIPCRRLSDLSYDCLEMVFDKMTYSTIDTLSLLSTGFHDLVDPWIWKEARVATPWGDKSRYTFSEMRQLSPLAFADVLSRPQQATCLKILHIGNLSSGRLDEFLLRLPRAVALQEVCVETETDVAQLWSALSGLKDLRKLTVRDSHGYHAAEWRESRLRSLCLTAVSDRACEPLELPHLESLSMRRDENYVFHPSSVVDLGLLKNLKHLSLSRTQDLDASTIKGTAGMLTSCEFEAVRGDLDNFFKRHSSSLESISLRHCGDSICAHFPRMRAVHILQCTQGIISGSSLPRLTHIFVDESARWKHGQTFNPCGEFAANLASTVQSLVFVANHEGFYGAEPSWFEPLTTAPSLLDLHLRGMHLPAVLDTQLFQRRLRHYSVGRDFDLERELPEWDPDHLLIPTRQCVARQERARRWSARQRQR